jgi:2-polyprenyl-6-methoxyphenol hydroxylase-like FAD-dependent oxidoreductase
VAPSPSRQVTIVGGRLGGLTAELRDIGVWTRVLEAARQLGEVDAGIQTAPNASRGLIGLGPRPALERIHTEPQDQVRRRHTMLPYQAQGASQAMEVAAMLAQELGAVAPEGIDDALVRYVYRRAKHAGMVQDASLQNMLVYHVPDGPAQRERDEKLRRFDGQSNVSDDWLWRGTPLNDPDNEAISYKFAR